MAGRRCLEHVANRSVETGQLWFRVDVIERRERVERCVEGVGRQLLGLRPGCSNLFRTEHRCTGSAQMTREVEPRTRGAEAVDRAGQVLDESDEVECGAHLARVAAMRRAPAGQPLAPVTGVAVVDAGRTRNPLPLADRDRVTVVANGCGCQNVEQLIPLDSAGCGRQVEYALDGSTENRLAERAGRRPVPRDTCSVEMVADQAGVGHHRRMEDGASSQHQGR